MKKALLSLLLCTFSFHLYAISYTNKTKELYLTVGVPYTVTPYIDLSIPENYINESHKLELGRGQSYDHQPYYSVSDESAFSILSTCVLSTIWYGKSYATEYSYTLTPQKTGYYTFSSPVSWYININDESTSTMTYNITVVDLTALTLGTNTLSLYLGETYNFVPTLTHPKATTSLTWVSSNTSVATIDGNGLLTTTGIGTTTITCTAHNGVSAQCVVTVNPVMSSGIALNVTETTMAVGKTLQMKATVTPENATNKGVTWSSSNEAVAMVNESGLVHALGEGTCQIKATAKDGSGATASCMLTVKDADYVSDYVISSVNDWQAFAAATLKDPYINAKMTADIDLGDVQTTIGTWEVPYEGHFDGQGHTLTVHLESTEGILAPFRFVKNCIIEGLHVTGSIHTTSQTPSGILGYALDEESDNGTTIRRCRVSALISSDMDSNGGIAAGGTYNFVIEDCLFDGSFADNNNYACGGFVNHSGYGLTIRNSLNLGTFPPAEYACGTFIRTDSDSGPHTLENLYYLNPFGVEQGTQVTTDQLADGTVTALLQAGREETVWIQDETTHRPMLAVFAMDKCATPTATMNDGVLTFSCDTEGVTFHYKWTAEGDGSRVTIGQTTIHLMLYATRDGMRDSDVAEYDLLIAGGSDKNGDVNGDGRVDVADIATIISIMASQSRMQTD